MDSTELLKSASAGGVAGSSAIFERHAARVDDLAQAILGSPRAPLHGGAATFVETSLRLYGLSENDPLARWLSAVSGQEAGQPAPAQGAGRSRPRSDADLKLAASAAFERSAPPPFRARPRPLPAPDPEPAAPVLVLKVSAPPPREGQVEPLPEPAAEEAPAAPPPPPDPPGAAGGPSGVALGLRVPSGATALAGGRGQRAARRRLVAVAALIAAALLLGGALLIVAEDDQRTALRSGTTVTSALPGSTTFPEPTAPAEVGAPLVPPAPGTTAASGPATSVAAAATTSAPPTSAAPGALFPTLDTVGLPAVDPTSGTARGVLPLRNRGQAVSYATTSSFAGLTVDKPTGSIAPGATTQFAVTLDGTKAPEGPFRGTLTFGGSGGPQQVVVTSTVGRPPVVKDAGEACPPGSPPCSPLILLVPGPAVDPAPSPCNTPWRYSVTVEDESRLKAVRAAANLGGRDGALRKDGAPTGTAGLWQSEVFPPLQGPVVLSFTVHTVDQFDFGRTTPARTIEC